MEGITVSAGCAIEHMGLQDSSWAACSLLLDFGLWGPACGGEFENAGTRTAWGPRSGWRRPELIIQEHQMQGYKEMSAGSQGWPLHGVVPSAARALSCDIWTMWAGWGSTQSLVIFKCRMGIQVWGEARSPVRPLVLLGPWHQEVVETVLATSIYLGLALALQSSILIKVKFSFESVVLEHYFIDFYFCLQERDVFSCWVAEI